MSTLLIVDDEPNVLYSLQKRLGSETLEADPLRLRRCPTLTLKAKLRASG